MEIVESGILHGYPKSILSDDVNKERFWCSYCGYILRNPVQASACGHRFCADCVSKITKNSRCEKCFTDESVTTYIDFNDENSFLPDKAMKRELDRLRYKCPHKDCPEKKLEYNNLDKHITECQYRLEKCSNQCGVAVAVIYITKHQSDECIERKVECPDCLVPVTYKMLNHHRDTDCIKFKIICEFCGNRIHKSHLDSHYSSECPVPWAKSMRNDEEDNIFYCPYGCSEHDEENNNESLLPKALYEHRTGNIHRHLDVLLATLIENGYIKAEEEDEIGDPTKKRLILKPGATQVETLNTMKSAKKEVLDKLSQMEDVCKKADFSDRQMIKEEFIKLTQRIRLQNERILKLESNFQSWERSNSYGSVIWRIDDVAESLKEAVQGLKNCKHGPIFHSWNGGYQMTVLLYLNGDGDSKGSHISLFVSIMQGTFDALLRWPFSLRVTFTLMNQNSNKHHTKSIDPLNAQGAAVNRPISEMNKPFGISQFIPISDVVPSSSYVVQNTMFVKVSVDTTSYL